MSKPKGPGKGGLKKNPAEKKPPTKKGIRFQEEVTVTEIPGLAEYRNPAKVNRPGRRSEEAVHRLRTDTDSPSTGAATGQLVDFKNADVSDERKHEILALVIQTVNEVIASEALTALNGALNIGGKQLKNYGPRYEQLIKLIDRMQKTPLTDDTLEALRKALNDFNQVSEIKDKTRLNTLINSLTLKADPVPLKYESVRGRGSRACV